MNRDHIRVRLSLARRRLARAVPPAAPRVRRVAPRALRSLGAALGAFSVLSFYTPPQALGARRPLAPLLTPPLVVRASADAFGRSGALQMRFALPGGRVAYPLEVLGDPEALRYTWTRLSDSTAVGVALPLQGDTLLVPSTPGLYRLALLQDSTRTVLDSLTVAVLVPFSEKQGALLDGYRIGLFPSERGRAPRDEAPLGFVPVLPQTTDLQLTPSIRLGDFLTRDGQTTWPRFAAVSPRVLDKIELVLAQLRQWRPSGAGPVQLRLAVQSAFRSPSYNRTVPLAAQDSRHQYGDALDVSVDANGDGRLTEADARLVAKAVEAVEVRYPELTGGMGLYTSSRYSHPYVHIDARGTRARWHV